jgi:(2Fe-2S) ferredoxin
MSKYENHRSDLNVQGRFLGFAAKDSYKLKYLRLSVNSDELTIKIPKELRLALYRTLTPGDWIAVSGYQEFCPQKGTTKLKAAHIVPTVPTAVSAEPESRTALPFVPKSGGGTGVSEKKSNILVCQKSDCCKRGGRALMEALQAELGDRGLADQVAIKPTGCMKQCKAGPNLVMPDKTRYSRIRPSEVPALIEKYFPAPSEPGVA